jgi:3-methyladenine DNA glycosylase AlkC
VGAQLIPLDRRGARRKVDVPPHVLSRLAAGEAETVNLMEWLSADMAALARTVARQTPSGAIKAALEEAACQMEGQPILARLKTAGRALAGATPNLDNRAFRALSEHRSDLVRQWTCYAVNDPSVSFSFSDRLKRTLPFAADRNMSVREAAWMAFRPHLQKGLLRSLKLLERTSSRRDPNLRRFAVEVSRPRSVWGAHIEELKRDPHMALVILQNVKSDPSRYVQLAAGNWLNDASKTRPDWVLKICEHWLRGADWCTQRIVKRGLRTLLRDERFQGNGLLRDLQGTAFRPPPSLAVEARRLPC